MSRCLKSEDRRPQQNEDLLNVDPLEYEDPRENGDREKEDPLKIISVRRKIDGTY